MKGWKLAGWIFVAAIALGLRTPRLDLRPMHNDEGVNAVKFGQLYVNNSYKYDPNEFHGPALPYFTLPAAWLEGGGPFNNFTPATFRGVTVVFGLGLVLLPWLLRRDLGEAEAWWIALLTAISPVMVFYSRDYIHEMLLVFFTGLAFAACWRAGRGGGMVWTITAGIAFGLMAATKETFVFTLAAMGLAVLCAWRWRRSAEWRWKWRHVGGALLLAVVVAALFYSSFFANPAGLPDAVRTYLPWLRRVGGETAHAHPWDFYFRRLFFFHAAGGPIWTEAAIGALALIGFIQSFTGKTWPRALIAFYTLWLTIIYTALPYKTPWCLLGFYDGILFLAGCGAVALWRFGKWPALVVLLAALGQLTAQTWRENFGASRAGVLYCASPVNPYVYSQTSPDFLRLVDTVNGLAKASPEGYKTVVEVISPESYWPLPWYLRRFDPKDVGYWNTVPNQPLAPIMIVAASLNANLDKRPGKTHLMAGYFQLRPGIFLELYVNTNLWRHYVKTLPPDQN